MSDGRFFHRPGGCRQGVEVASSQAHILCGVSTSSQERTKNIRVPRPLLFWNLFLPKLEETNESFFGGNWYSMVDLHTLMLLLLLLLEALPYNAIGEGAKFPPGSLISHAVN